MFAVLNCIWAFLLCTSSFDSIEPSASLNLLHLFPVFLKVLSGWVQPSIFYYKEFHAFCKWCLHVLLPESKFKVYFTVPKWIKVVVNLLENRQQLLTFWTRIQVFWCNLFCQILNTGFPLSPICIYPAEPHPVALHHFCMYISISSRDILFPKATVRVKGWMSCSQDDETSTWNFQQWDLS